MAGRRGVYRIRNHGVLPDSVWVTDGLIGFEMPETRYVKAGYQPDVEELPWDNDAAETQDPHQ